MLKKNVTNITVVNQDLISSKDGKRMESEKKLRKYIDSTIREYAYKSIHNYDFDSYYHLDNNEKENLCDVLFEHDPVTREFILDRINELVEERIDFVFSEDKYDNGFEPRHHSDNGEVYWVRR